LIDNIKEISSLLQFTMERSPELDPTEVASPAPH